MIRLPLPHYILAGGRSRRFGRDKARYEIDGVPMLTRVAEAMRPLATRTTGIARTESAYQDLGLNTIADAIPDAGPLGGVYTALSHAAGFKSELHPVNDWVLITSCDWHQPDPHRVRALAEHQDLQARVVAYKQTSWIEPFPALYCVGMMATAKRRIKQNSLAMQGLFEELGSAVSIQHLDQAEPLDLDTAPDLDAPNDGQDPAS